MKLVQKVLLVFALLVTIGGIVGYATTDPPSTPSLIAGVISGVLLLYSCWLWGQKPLVGFILGLAVSIALLGRFTGVAFSKGLAMWPTGVVIFFSAVTIVVLIGSFLKERKNSSMTQETAAADEGASTETGKAEAEEDASSEEA
ncbi:MAG: TMEM14 family protein [Planctomycetota bacterium]|jgi:uncharacterized membrane protein (UPF0136 family)